MSTTPFSVVESAVVPLPLADIDTDQIIPGRFITSRTPAQFARALFAQRRATEPDFVLNRSEMAGRSILLTGRNFGCGSSREQAVWALQAGGFRVVIAPSFGDIFASNAMKNGLLVVALAQADYAILATDVRGPTVRVDLTRQRLDVLGTDRTMGFDIDPFYRELMLSGQSELDYLLAAGDQITRYEQESGHR